MNQALLLCGFAAIWVSIGGIIGGWKGRRRLGMALGFFLGPIGWMVLLFLSPVQKCPRCRASIPTDAVVCMYCRTPTRQP